MIERIKQTDIKNEDVNLNDANLAKEEGPNGEKVEPSRNFILYFTEENKQYVDTSDNQFNPSKKYFLKEGASRVSVASPLNLNLYQFNGLNYVPSKDKEFKDKDYFLDAEGEELATPTKCRLKEADTSTSSRKYYPLKYVSNDGQTTQIAKPTDWETAKALYEGCVNATDEINSVYETEGLKAVKPFVEEHFNEIVGKYKENVLLKQQRIGAENSLRLTANRNSMLYNNTNYRAMIEKKILEETGKTLDDYIKSVTSNRISREDINKFNDIAGRRITFKNNKYYVTTPRADGIFILKNGKGGYLDKVAFDTLDEALNGIVLLNTVRDNLINNIKGKSLEETQELYNEASDLLLEQLNMAKTSNYDSYKYCTYEIKDNKKFITGYYDSFEDALIADGKLVKKMPGVYFNEDKGTYLAIPQPVYNEDEISEQETYKIVRLGEFKSQIDAINAIRTLANLKYDVEKFFMSNFYQNHLDECQEARDYYFKENKEAKTDCGIEKQGDVYKIWYINPDTNEKYYLDEDFVKENQAMGLIKQCEGSPDTAYDFFRDYIENKEELHMENQENLKEFEAQGIKQKPLTRADLEKLIKDLNADDFDDNDIMYLLTGSFGGRAGGLYIFQNVIDLLKEKYNFDEKDIDYNAVLVLQNRLMNRRLKDILNYLKPNLLNDYHDYKNDKEFLEYCDEEIAKEFDVDSLKKIISPRGLKALHKEILAD